MDIEHPIQSSILTMNNENNQDNKALDGTTHSRCQDSRSKDQRRRLLVAALAGAPAIVAGSAQNAYASGSAGSGTS